MYVETHPSKSPIRLQIYAKKSKQQYIFYKNITFYHPFLLIFNSKNKKQWPIKICTFFQKLRNFTTLHHPQKSQIHNKNNKIHRKTTPKVKTRCAVSCRSSDRKYTPYPSYLTWPTKKKIIRHWRMKSTFILVTFKWLSRVTKYIMHIYFNH